MNEEKEFKKSNFGLKWRILTIVIPMMIIGILATVLVAFSYNRGVIIERTKDIVQYSAEGNANAIDKDIGGALKELYVYKLNMTDGRMTKIQLNRMLKNTYQKSELYPDGLYYADSNGSWIDGAGWQPGDDYVVTEQTWFKEGITHTGGFELGNPYVDANTGKMVVTASVNISENASLTKVLAADIPLASLIEYVKGISFFGGAGGSVLINERDGSIIAATTMNENLEVVASDSVNKLYEKIGDAEFLENITEVTTVNAGGQSYYVYPQKLEGCDWMLVSYVSSYDAIDKQLNHTFLVVVLIALAIILFSGLVVDRFIAYKAKQITNVTESIEKITDGDFTESFVVKGSDETGVMTYSLGIFLTKMRDMLQKLNGMTTMLGKESENSMGMSSNLSKASADSYQSMKEMIRTLEQLSNSVEEIAESSTSLAINVNNTNERCKRANEVLMETVGLSEEGQNEMDEVGNSMNRIQEVIDVLNDAVENVGCNMKSIVDMVNVIGDISSQTNLLSLNASIEAARAGDAGRGFAVVAQEIGNLAENSSKSVVDIKNVTDSINTMVVQMVEKMEQSVTSIRECGEVVRRTQKTFGDINHKILDTKDEVLGIINEVVELDTVSQSLAAITQEQSASSEEMLATSENVLEHSEHVKHNAEDGAKTAEQLTEIVAELNELLSFFKYEV